MKRYLADTVAMVAFSTAAGAFVEIVVTGLRKTVGALPADGGRFVVEAAYLREGGNAQQVMAPSIARTAPPGWDVSVQALGTEVLLKVHGAAIAAAPPLTFQWSCTRPWR